MSPADDQDTHRPTAQIAKLIAAAALACGLCMALLIGMSVTVPAAMMASLIGANSSSGGQPAGPGNVPGINQILLQALNTAAGSQPKCSGLRWQVLAGIGQVESNLARGVTIDSVGDTRPRILGIALDGTNGTKAIKDTDSGRWDGDKVWDRAVGPFQFIPSSWQIFGVDGNDDDNTNPNNVFDAAAAAATHLCANDADLSNRDGLAEAIFAYNNSNAYVTAVLEAITAFDQQAQPPDDSEPGEPPPFDGNCVVDANLPRKNPHTCAEAIRAARKMVGQQCRWLQLCLGFTAVAYGWNVSGTDTAYNHFLALQRQGYIHTDRNPPPGALVFWKGSGIYGHIAIAVGGGQIASNDISRSGCIDIVAWNAPETQWGQNYLGWAPPYFPNGS